MSDREIMNAKGGVPMWWKPGIAFLKEDWIKHPHLKQFKNKPSWASTREQGLIFRLIFLSALMKIIPKSIE